MYFSFIAVIMQWKAIRVEKYKERLKSRGGKSTFCNNYRWKNAAQACRNM